MHHGHNLRERLIEKGVVRRRSDEKLGYRHMDKVMRDRTVVGHAVPMSVFATTEMVMWTESDNLGWADVHQGPLAIHTTPGNHESMLTERFAGELTALLSASLSEMSAGSRIPTSAAALAGPAVEEPDDPQPVGAGTHADA
jgi:hypothetical protein